MNVASPFLPTVQLTCEFCTMKFATIPALIQHTRTTHIDRLNSPNAYMEHLNRLLSVNYGAITNFRGEDLYKRKPDSLSPIHHQNLSIKPELSSPNSIASRSVSRERKSSLAADNNSDVEMNQDEQDSPTDLSNKRASSADGKENEERGSPVSDGRNSLNLSSSVTPHHSQPAELQNSNSRTCLCNHCNAAFPSFESFSIHLNQHLKQGELSMGNMFFCQVCGLSMSNQADYEQHLMLHFQANSTEYVCTANCNRSFSKSEDLQKHLLETHAQNIWKCTICSELVESKVAVQVHLAVAHTNEIKVIRCQACMECFKSEKDFRHHVKTRHGAAAAHTGSLQCSFCHVVCSTDLEMQLHLVAHSRQFRCPACPEVFHVEFLLDCHMQTNHCGMVKEATPSSQYKTKNNNLLNYHYSVAGAKSLYPFGGSTGNKLYNPLQIEQLKNPNSLYGFYDSLKAGYADAANKHASLYNAEMSSNYYIANNDQHGPAPKEPNHASATHQKEREREYLLQLFSL